MAFTIFAGLRPHSRICRSAGLDCNAASIGCRAGGSWMATRNWRTQLRTFRTGLPLLQTGHSFTHAGTALFSCANSAVQRDLSLERVPTAVGMSIILRAKIAGAGGHTEEAFHARERILTCKAGRTKLFISRQFDCYLRPLPVPAHVPVWPGQVDIEIALFHRKRERSCGPECAFCWVLERHHQ